MGVVYQAHDPQFDRMLALKVLRQDRVISEEFVKRFLKEARAIGRLSHPNVVTAYDAGEDQGTIYLAMEFIEGKPLNEIVQERRFKQEEILSLGIQVAETLHYAHQKGVIHRDVKPGNIMVQPDGVIKIADFGIARIEDPSATFQTQAGEIMGTPAYMSPEQVLGKPVDGRSDLFSLGVILYELTTGKRPFATERKNLATIFNEIIHIHPPEPAKENPAIEPGLSAIIMKCLSKAPEDRFESCLALAEALRKYGKEPESVASAKQIVVVKEKPRRLGIYLAFLLGIALVFGVSAAILFKGHTVSPPRKEASMHVDSKPQGAEIYADEVLKGTTPKDFGLPPGGYSIRMALPGYEKWEDKIQVEEAREYPLQVELKALPRQALLRLGSAPPGADIYVDSVSKGKTPADLELPPGGHAIRLLLSGYKDWEQEVRLEEAKEYPLQAELNASPKQALLRAESTPSGAEIYVDGTSRGIVPISLELALGRHIIRMTLPGYQDWEEQIEFKEAGEYPPMNPRLILAPKQAFLSVESVPSGARISVNGKPIGETPLEHFELSPGEHKVQLSLKNYQNWEGQVQLEAAKEYPLKTTLIRIPEKTDAKAPAKAPSKAPEKKPDKIMVKPADEGWKVNEPVVTKIK